MKLSLNGEITEADAGTLYELLESCDLVDGVKPQDLANRKVKGVAVVVNDAVVSSHQWKTFQLNENDHIEIVRAIQGG